MRTFLFLFARFIDQEETWKYTNGLGTLGCMNNADFEGKIST